MGEEFECLSIISKPHEIKCLLTLEIVSARDFDLDFLYVQYLVEVPDGWLVADDAKLSGSTVQAISRFEKVEKCVHFRACVCSGAELRVQACTRACAHVFTLKSIRTGRR